MICVSRLSQFSFEELLKAKQKKASVLVAVVMASAAPDAVAAVLRTISSRTIPYRVMKTKCFSLLGRLFAVAVLSSCVMAATQALTPVENQKDEERVV